MCGSVAGGGFAPAQTGNCLHIGDNTQNSQPSGATQQEEEREARADHAADRPPTDSEEKAAPDREDLGQGVAEHAEEMAERGANVKGEGELP